MQLKGEKRAAATYFGDGGTSSSDVHAALNFAATMAAPVVFLCRNNGFAISTPSSEQFVGAGVAERAAAYGIRTLRVDGADALAVYAAVAQARAHAVQHNYPVLIEVRAPACVLRRRNLPGRCSHACCAVRCCAGAAVRKDPGIEMLAACACMLGTPERGEQ